ncbi:MAG TPA: hypothetical protein VLG49_06860 [Rhabdochlamydiaceae bacterium]|nr:hypothetical protein [Rhabdochlamydiaceae bacterium]
MRSNRMVLVCAVSIFPIMAFASFPDTGSVSSAQAAYDGNALVLTGHVVLDHGLGKMNAEQASLQRQENGKDFPFSMIHLHKDVLLSLKTNAEIRCDSADLDFTALKGFLSSTGTGKVVYTDTLKQKNDTAVFRILSQKVELGMSKQGHDGNKTDYEIETILAKEDVIVDYANEFTLRADHALYRKEALPKGKKSSKEFQGVISAYPKDAKSQCRLTHEGDIIDADSIDLDMPNSKLSMYRPKGFILSSLFPGLQKGEVQFTCDHLTWQHDKDTLLLKGHVQVNENCLGTLTSDDELFITQSIQDGKRTLKSLRAKGKTSLEYKETDDKIRKLNTNGSIRIDQEKLQAFIDSPELQGKVLPEQQLSYEDEQFTIYSDKANLEYSVVDDALQPVSITLRGNVRLLSRDQNKPPRIASADRVNYSPSTQTLILGANPGKRVLFCDEAQSMRISAQEIHVTHNPETHEESVKGIGNVKFAFTVEETDILNKIFPSFLLNHQEKMIHPANEAIQK